MEQHFQISERKYKTFKNQIPDPVNIIALDKSKTLTGRWIYIYIYIYTYLQKTMTLERVVIMMTKTSGQFYKVSGWRLF